MRKVIISHKDKVSKFDFRGKEKKDIAINISHCSQSVALLGAKVAMVDIESCRKVNMSACQIHGKTYAIRSNVVVKNSDISCMDVRSGKLFAEDCKFYYVSATSASTFVRCNAECIAINDVYTTYDGKLISVLYTHSETELMVGSLVIPTENMEEYFRETSGYSKAQWELIKSIHKSYHSHKPKYAKGIEIV